MLPAPREEVNPFAETDELPIVADPDLCSDDDLPDTLPDPNRRRERKILIVD
jgi:hypothetical protein